jgi:hypothetical protein
MFWKDCRKIADTAAPEHLSTPPSFDRQRQPTPGTETFGDRDWSDALDDLQAATDIGDPIYPISPPPSSRDGRWL